MLATKKTDLGRLKVYATEFSQAERSILCAWKASVRDVQYTGPLSKTFALPHMLFVGVDNDALLEQWITECSALDLQYVVLESGFLPPTFRKVDVVFLRPQVVSAIHTARNQVCNTMAFTMRMYHEGGFLHSLQNNEERTRKL